MVNRLMNKYGLSRRGAGNLIKGSIAIAVQNFCFMFPVGLMYLMIKAFLEDGSLSGISQKCLLGGSFVCLVLIFISSWIQYELTYMATYKESGVRRIDLAEKMRELPLSFFGKRNVADLSNVIMHDAQQMEVAFSHNIPGLYGSVISTVVMGGGLFFFDWRMALAAFWVVPVAVVMVKMSKSVQKTLNSKFLKAQLKMESKIQEGIEAARDLKACNAEETYLDEFEQIVDEYEKQSYVNKFGINAFVMSSGVILKFGIVTVSILGVMLLLQGKEKGISLIEFIFWLLVVSRLYEPLQGILNNMVAINAVNLNIQRTKEIFNSPVQGGKEEFFNKSYDIAFEHVGFAYNGEQEILEDVSFVAKQGEITALVGSSGSGKTTVSRLAARFWDVDRGGITIGGINVADVNPEVLMSMFSIVFQDVLLFDDTILENIRLGRIGATDEEVMEAARAAGCYEFVERLPDKWETMIGENGRVLSGGERQRISIARALLKDAPIILLDEATASLDVENETKIQTALTKLIQNKTVMVIAHRMRTVMNAHRIVVLSDGKVAECGTPEELLEKNGIFAQMVEIQRRSEHWKLEL